MKKQTAKELESLAKTYINARDKLLDIIINYKGVGTKTYYNTVLKNLTAEIKRLEAETGKYIGSAIPREYEQGLKDTYDYFKKNNLTMNRPSAFAQIHNDAIYGLAREMQYHIGQGVEQAGRQVLRYLDESRDNALRKAGLEASAEKIAMGSTVQDMQRNLIERLQNEGFMTVQYGSGKNAYQVGLDSYATMVARSTTREAGNLARENQLIESGYDLVEMTVHYPTCDKCAQFQGRVYSLTGKDKRFPALMQTAFKSGYRNVHPNCRHSIVPYIEELQTNEEIQTAIAKSNKPFEYQRSDSEKDLDSKGQVDNRQIRQDRYQYERYKARLGDDAPKSFHSFRKMKKAGGEKWEQLQKSYKNWLQKNKETDIMSKARADLKTLGVEYNPIKKHRKPLTEAEIIARVGGGDRTKGSCSSLAFAHIGNKSGYDVLDYRDGESRFTFSRSSVITEIAKLPHVNGIVVNEMSDFTAAAKLFETVEDGKEYYLGIGGHAAIIRKRDNVFEYLELQTDKNNGFKPLTKKDLIWRFNCKNSRTSFKKKYAVTSQLIESESLGRSEEFRKLLGYINTAESEQKKGKEGHAK